MSAAVVVETSEVVRPTANGVVQKRKRDWRCGVLLNVVAFVTKGDRLEKFICLFAMFCTQIAGFVYHRRCENKMKRSSVGSENKADLSAVNRND